MPTNGLDFNLDADWKYMIYKDLYGLGTLPLCIMV